MSEVRTKVEGIIRVEENKQRATKNASIVVTQNNTQSKFPKYQETKKKPEERQRQPERRSEQKKRLIQSKEKDYSCNPQKKFKSEEEEFDYTFTMPQEKIFAELKD